MGYDRSDSFLSILNQMDFHLVQNRKENFRYDHIPFNVEGNGNIVFSVHSNPKQLLRAGVALIPGRISTARNLLMIRQEQILMTTQEQK